MKKISKSSFALSYSYIEKLVILCKNGDPKAKETLAQEFAPFIRSISKKAYIYSYEAADIINECYKTLFKCVKVYNPDMHRFTAYAYNAMKNSINCLIRNSIRRAGAEGKGSYILDEGLEDRLCTEPQEIYNIIHKRINISKLKAALSSLTSEERELVNFIYFKDHSLRKYSLLKGITYYEAKCKKDSILKKLKI